MTTRRYCSHTSKGFTLVELIVVVGMISILGAISYPSVSGMIQKYQFRAAAYAVLNTAMLARANAVRDNASWQLQIAADGATYKFDLLDPDLNIISSYVPDNGISLLPPGANINCGNATKNWNGTGISQAAAITFTGRGFSDNGSIYLEDAESDTCFAINTSISGVVRVRRYNGALPYADSNWLD